MMMDALALFSDAQTLVISVGTALSDKSYDLGAGGTVPQGGTAVVDPGRGFLSADVFCQITTAVAATGGASTLSVSLVMADDAALTSNLVVLYTTAAISKTVLVAGYQFRMGRLPPGITKRYVGLRYTVATNDITTGVVTAGLVWNRQSDGQAFV